MILKGSHIGYINIGKISPEVQNRVPVASPKKADVLKFKKKKIYLNVNNKMGVGGYLEF